MSEIHVNVFIQNKGTVSVSQNVMLQVHMHVCYIKVKKLLYDTTLAQKLQKPLQT